MTTLTRAELMPGDVLLYAPSSFWSYVIAVKTWNKVSHIEGYIGSGLSVAAREGIGVGMYDMRTRGVTHVVRPPAFDLEAAMRWFATVDGQGYDWWGLTRFVLWGSTPVNNPRKQFCSEFMTRWLRHGGCDPFNPERDADSVAPSHFLYIPPPWTCHRYVDKSQSMHEEEEEEEEDKTFQ